MPYADCRDLDAVDAGLREAIGPPALTFAELHDAELFGPRAWYVETFADGTPRGSGSS